jgi:hypothetical protein
MRYAMVRFSDEAERTHFVSRMLMRRHGIEREVGHFMRSLWAERRSLSTPPDSFGELVHHKALLLWAKWQLVLNGALRGPVGALGRRWLSVVRGLRSRATATRRKADAGVSPPEAPVSGDAERPAA